MALSSAVENLLGVARSRIERWAPSEARRLVRGGALLVDIRPERQRLVHGQVPGGLVVERNVFEWRLDPTSEWRVAEASAYDRVVIVLCQEGYASSLAAASLLDLGYRRAGDVVGGFLAWRAAGLPVEAWPAGQKRLVRT